MADKAIDELTENLAKVTVEAPSASKEQKEAAGSKKAPNGYDLSLKGVASAIKEGKIKNVIVMTGAGISVSAGIPDFRSPGTGLYDNLQKYNLPAPEAIFSIDFFKQHPEAFCTLAKELYPGHYKATPTHCFIRLLEDKKILLRNFTQNIDTLEFEAGISRDLVVQAHGGFDTAHCLGCKKSHSPESVKEVLFKDKVPRCDCGALIKPDIVFFGEGLPERFHTLSCKDFPQCDLLLILGTSLQVHPFANLINRPPKECVRVLFNREPAGVADEPQVDKTMIKRIEEAARQGDMQAHAILVQLRMASSRGLRFNLQDNKRDIFHKGDCDDGVREFAKLLGWEKDLDKIIEEVDTRFLKKNPPKQESDPSDSKSINKERS